MRLAAVPLALILAPLMFSAPTAEPKAVAAWPSGPLEVRLAFDGPVSEAVAKGFEGGSIAFGEPAPNHPGRLGSTAGRIGIAAARVVDGGRTIVLATDPHPRESTYILPIPGTKDVIAYRLGGVEVAWDDGKENARPGWSGWWPSIDPLAARKALAGSAEHDRGFDLLGKPGRLTIRTLLALPAGKVTLRLKSDAPVVATVSGQEAKAEAGTAVLAFESTGEAVDLDLSLTTGAGGRPPTLLASYRLGDDPADRPIPPGALILPWAPAPPSAPPATDSPSPDLSGGDPGRGEAVFRSAESKCATCHKVGGQGGEVGPALDSVAGRDRGWIYRSIAVPSAEINPEYVPYTVALKDGRIAAGIVRGQGLDAIRVLDAEGKPTIVAKAEIEELRPSGTSIMPVGLEGAIGPEKMRDLVAYLAAPKPIGPKK